MAQLEGGGEEEERHSKQSAQHRSLNVHDRCGMQHTAVLWRRHERRGRRRAIGAETEAWADREPEEFTEG